MIDYGDVSVVLATEHCSVCGNDGRTLWCIGILVPWLIRGDHALPVASSELVMFTGSCADRCPE